MTNKEWFKQAKFGMMIHFGLYSLLGGEWKGERTPHIGEWAQSYFNIPNSEYGKLAHAFNPVYFNADEWVQLAVDAGMQYIVMTSKHHDGFALFKSEWDSYNCVDGTPFGRDIVAELAESCRKHGIKFGLYYDPNLRKPLWKNLEEAKEQLLWGLQYADVVKISDEEVEFLFGLDPKAGAAHILENYPVKLVFVTCGADGCVFQNKTCSGHVPGLSGISVVDTTGAGDIFGGGAVSWLLKYEKAPEELNEEELRQIVRFACTAAGLSTTKPGGISSVPALEAVLEKM